MEYLASPGAAKVWAKAKAASSRRTRRSRPAYTTSQRNERPGAGHAQGRGPFDMSDQAPAAFGGTKGRASWEILQVRGRPERPEGTARRPWRRRPRRTSRKVTHRPPSRPTRARPGGGRPPVAVLFLLPALLLLGALVVYPIVYSVGRSLYDASGGTSWASTTTDDIRPEQRPARAIRNTAIWVVVAPTPRDHARPDLRGADRAGPLAHRVQDVVFMPMAVSFLAAGVIFRLVYERGPAARSRERGRAERRRHRSSRRALIPGARPAATTVQTGRTAASDEPAAPPGRHRRARAGRRSRRTSARRRRRRGERRPRQPGGIRGRSCGSTSRTGGGGAAGAVDPTEKGLPGMTSQAVRDGHVAATTTDGARRAFPFSDLPRATITRGCPRRTSRSRTPGSLARPGAGHPAIIVVVPLDLGRLRDGP